MPKKKSQLNPAAASIDSVKDLQQSTVFSSPTRGETLAQNYKSPSKTEGQGRFLWSILSNLKYSEQLWHVITSTPDVSTFETAFAKLQLAISKFDDYTNLSKNLELALFGSRGVYYTLTARDIENCNVFAKHMAHTVIYEREHDVQIKGANHALKTKGTLEHIRKINQDLLKVMLAASANKDFLDVKVISDFILYMEWHVQALIVALNHKSETKLQHISVLKRTDNTEEDSISVLKVLHPISIAQITPAKLDDSDRSIITSYKKRCHRNLTETSLVDLDNSIEQATKSHAFSNSTNAWDDASEDELPWDEERFKATLKFSPVKKSKFKR